MTRRLQNGQAGEMAAEKYFRENSWVMIRTQPAVQILGVAPGRRFGTVFTCRMVSRGGVPDFTGYEPERRYSIKLGWTQTAHYRAVEVKEAQGDAMPCSRLDKAQREFMAALPGGCAWVGVFFVDVGKFEMFPFVEKGSYKRS